MVDLNQIEDRLSRLEAGVSDAGERLQEAEDTTSDLLEPNRPWLPPVEQVVESEVRTDRFLPFDVARREFADVDAGEASDLAYAMYVPCVDKIVRMFDRPVAPLTSEWPYNNPRRKGNWCKLPVTFHGDDLAYRSWNAALDLVIVEREVSASSQYAELSWYVAAYAEQDGPPSLPSGTILHWRIPIIRYRSRPGRQWWHGAFFHDIQRGYMGDVSGPTFTAGPSGVQTHGFFGVGTALTSVTGTVVHPGQDDEYEEMTLQLHDVGLTTDNHGALRHISHGSDWGLSFPKYGQCPAGPTGPAGAPGDDAECTPEDPGPTGPAGPTGLCGGCDICDNRGGYSGLSVTVDDHVIYLSWTNVATGETEDNHYETDEVSGETYEHGWAVPFNSLYVALGSNWFDGQDLHQEYEFWEVSGTMWTVEAVFHVNVGAADIDGFEDYVKDIARSMGVVCA